MKNCHDNSTGICSFRGSHDSSENCPSSLKICHDSWNGTDLFLNFHNVSPTSKHFYSASQRLPHASKHFHLTSQHSPRTTKHPHPTSQHHNTSKHPRPSQNQTKNPKQIMGFSTLIKGDLSPAAFQRGRTFPRDGIGSGRLPGGHLHIRRRGSEALLRWRLL